MPIRSTILPPLLYWFPCIADLADADPQTRDRLAGQPLLSTRAVRGPTAGEGLLVARQPADLVSYAPKRQTWHELRPTVWIGVEPGWKPDRFVRSAPLDGLWTTIGGRDWLVPQANPDLDDCSLPLVPWFAGGVLIPRPKHEHASLAARASHFHRRLRAAMIDGDAGLREEPLTVYQFVADGLAVNYDLSLDELLALEILDPASVTAAIHALTGWRFTIARGIERLQGGQEDADHAVE